MEADAELLAMRRRRGRSPVEYAATCVGAAAERISALAASSGRAIARVERIAGIPLT